MSHPRNSQRPGAAPHTPQPTPGADSVVDPHLEDTDNHTPFFFAELSDLDVEATLQNHPLLAEIDFDELFPLRSKLQ
jgi:hypothetical protein